MSNKTQLQTNNTELSQLITTLQGKATGGGGSVKTCTVTLTPEGLSLRDVIYTYLTDNGEIITENSGFCSPAGKTFECVCGTMISFRGSASTITDITVTNAEILQEDTTGGWIHITAPNGDIATITVLGVYET